MEEARALAEARMLARSSAAATETKEAATRAIDWSFMVNLIVSGGKIDANTKILGWVGQRQGGITGALYSAAKK